MCGADAWNTWRKSYPVRGGMLTGYQNCADFSHHCFEEDIGLDRVDFGNGAIFHCSIFKKWVSFRACEFGHKSDFSYSKFLHSAYFNDSAFGETVSFSCSEFHAEVVFGCCWFDRSLDFTNVSATHLVSFNGACIGSVARFDRSSFGLATFIGAMFDLSVHFEYCTFKMAHFDGVRWAQLSESLYQDMATWRQRCVSIGMEPDRLGRISFRGAKFGGAKFTQRVFEGEVSFDDVIFQKAPDFRDAKISQQTSFAGAGFPVAPAAPDEAENAAQSYRTLKLAFAQQQAVREEQLFFRLEMREEAVTAEGLRKWLIKAYEWTSGFGFEIARPLLRLGLLPSAVLSVVYLVLMASHDPVLWTGPIWKVAPSKGIQWAQFTLTNLMPIPGIDLAKELRPQLFGSSTFVAFVALVLEMVQKALAVAAFFLTALALRNLFKMK